MKIANEVGNVRLMQRINRLKVLEIIRAKGPLARPEIARMTGLSPSSITNKANIALTDLSGHILAMRALPIDRRLLEFDVLDLIKEEIILLLENKSIRRDKVIGIGMAVSGLHSKQFQDKSPLGAQQVRGGQRPQCRFSGSCDGVGIASIINLFNPQRIIINGDLPLQSVFSTKHSCGLHNKETRKHGQGEMGRHRGAHGHGRALHRPPSYITDAAARDRMEI